MDAEPDHEEEVYMVGEHEAGSGGEDDMPPLAATPGATPTVAPGDFSSSFKSKVIERLGRDLKHDMLRGAGRVNNVLSILTARVPIIKFVHTNSRLDCDVNVGNKLGIINTRLLRTYTMVDERFHMLGYTLKQWSKTVGINDASLGYISSYALINMLIHYMQHVGVLPYLQEMETEEHPKVVNEVAGHNCYFLDDIEQIKKLWRTSNTESAGRLLVGFFDYYCHFPFDTQVVCTRRPGPLTKEEKEWTASSIAIEDPFELTHNLTKGVQPDALSFVLECLIRSRAHFTTQLAQAPAPDVVATLLNAPVLTNGRAAPMEACFKCGKTGHRRSECPDEVCFRCLKPGHRRSECPNPPAQRGGRRQGGPGGPPRR